MTNQEFCYWLQGFFELSGTTQLDTNQLSIIRNHLNLVEAVVGKLEPFPAWLKQSFASFDKSQPLMDSELECFTLDIIKKLYSTNSPVSSPYR